MDKQHTVPEDLSTQEGLIGLVLRGMRWPGNIEREDLVQEGYLALMAAAETYNPKRGPWSSWAISKIRWRMKDYLRQEGLGRRTHRRNHVSLDELYMGQGEEATAHDLHRFEGHMADNRAEQDFEKVEDKDVIKTLVFVLNNTPFPDERDRWMLILKLHGMTQLNISRVFGISEARVSQILRRALRLVKEELRHWDPDAVVKWA